MQGSERSAGMPTSTPGTRESSAASTVVSDRFRAYPNYLDSGVEWLGKIPAHWAVKRLKHLLAESLKYGANEPAEFVDRGLPRYIRITDIRDDGTLRDDSFRSLSEETAKPYLLADGDILFARSGATVGKTFLYKSRWGRAAYAGYLIRARPDKCKIRADFVSYFTQSQTYNDWLLGNLIQATIQNVSAERYASLGIAVPSGGEQRIIARFLDRETAKIDALVAKKERLIELLQEKRSVLITRAVTKGLDPDVPMKETGVEWLGEIPAHWEVVALRRRWEIIDCKHVTVPFVDQGIPLASVRETQSFELNLSNARHTTLEWYAMLVEGKRGPRRGDLVYCRNVSVGSATFVNTDERFAMGQDVCTIRSAWENQRWLNYYLCSNTMSNQLATILVGSTFDRINVSEIRELLTPVPPRQQQDNITAFLDCESAKIDVLVTKVREAIDRLKELRTALISAAVTGKIDVREAAA